MLKKNGKETTAVLIHIPNDLYNKYVESLDRRHLKRQPYSAELFCEAIEKDLAEHEMFRNKES